MKLIQVKIQKKFVSFMLAKQIFVALGIPVSTVLPSGYKDKDISNPTTVEGLVSISSAYI